MPFDNPHQNPFGDLELLIDARDRISTHAKWMQGGFRDGERHCLVAALSVSSDSRSFKQPNETERRLSRLLVSQLPDSAPFLARVRIFPARQRLMWFNDSSSTHHDDVIALLERAMQRLTSTLPVCVSG